MYGKLIVAAVLGAFLFVRLGAALDCYSCNSPSNCDNPSTITCTTANANATLDHLNTYFSGVSNSTSTDFNCLFHNYTLTNVSNVTYRGCVYRTTKPCSLTLNAAHASLVRQNCTECSGDLCNGNSPAGTFSSSVVAMFGSIVALMIAKAVVQ